MSPAEPPRGVAITGTIGAGKTALAEALSELLHARSLRHALVDVDWLGQLYPPPDPAHPYSLELAFRNLRAIVPNFLMEGARYFVIAVTLTSRDELEELRRSIPAVSLTVCRVDASAAVIAQRIRQRELGSLKNDFLSRTNALAEQIERAGVADLVIRNERPIAEGAEELLRRLEWT